MRPTEDEGILSHKRGISMVDCDSDSESATSKQTTFERYIGKIVGEIFATVLGQGKIFEKIHSRVGTNIGSTEGDHVTASVVLKEIVYNEYLKKNVKKYIDKDYHFCRDGIDEVFGYGR